MGPVGPRYAPCWPHEPCCQGDIQRLSVFLTTQWMFFHTGLFMNPIIILCYPIFFPCHCLGIQSLFTHHHTSLLFTHSVAHAHLLLMLLWMETLLRVIGKHNISPTLSQCTLAGPVYTGMPLECHWLTQCTLGYHWATQRIVAGYTGTPLEKLSWHSPHWNATGGTLTLQPTLEHHWRDCDSPDTYS